MSHEDWEHGHEWRFLRERLFCPKCGRKITRIWSSENKPAKCWACGATMEKRKETA